MSIDQCFKAHNRVVVFLFYFLLQTIDIKLTEEIRGGNKI